LGFELHRSPARALLLVHTATSDELAGDPEAYCLNWLLEEVSTSSNMVAARGNASLIAIS
jgi:RHH-type proline utilization regulon transcriptional repressor/proline dehydrogenase/delta 1-pyrroline-5-carboxylate dehydrogenase